MKKEIIDHDFAWWELMEKRLQFIMKDISTAQTEMDKASTAPTKSKEKYRWWKTVRWMLQREKKYLEELSQVCHKGLATVHTFRRIAS